VNHAARGRRGPRYALLSAVRPRTRRETGWAGFLFRLETVEGEPADPPTLSAAVPDWRAGAHDPPGSQDASSRRQAGRRRGQPACTCRRAGLTAELNVLVVVRRTRARNHHEQGERRSTSGPGLASYPYARSADRGRSEHSPMLRRGSRSPGNGLRLGRFASACRGQHMSAAGTAASTTRALWD